MARRREPIIPKDYISKRMEETSPTQLEGPTEVDSLIQVTPDWDPNVWGQGPDKSTRVQNHWYEPSYTPAQYALAGEGREVSSELGTVYVTFWKNNDQYAYTNVPRSVYDDFASNNSKGHFINTTLNNYSYYKVANVPGPFPVEKNLSESDAATRAAGRSFSEQFYNPERSTQNEDLDAYENMLTDFSRKFGGRNR